MLTSERKAWLLDRLAVEGRLGTMELARELDVSEDTVRRDLRELAAEGRLLRVHGGALPVSPTHAPLAERRGMQGPAKTRLGRAGAKLVRDGMTVILDGGTTHLELVNHLPRALRATVVTHAPAIASALEPFEGVEVVLVGGTLLRLSMVALGTEATRAFSRVAADLLLLGVTGVHETAGLTTGHPAEAEMKALLVERTAQVAVLATPDKLGRASPFLVAPLAAAGTLLTVGVRPGWLPAGVAHQSA